MDKAMVNFADNVTQDDQRARVKRIVAMVADLDWDTRPEKASLDELADEITIDGTEADPAAITIDGHEFRGLGPVVN